MRVLIALVTLSAAALTAPAVARAKVGPSGCIAKVLPGIYDAPSANGPVPGAYRIAIVDGCVQASSFGGARAIHDRVVGSELHRSWSDGKACHSGWKVKFRGFSKTIKAAASKFSTCGGNRERVYGEVTLRRVAKIPGTPLTLLDHSDVQVGLAAVEKVASQQSSPAALAALDAAIRRGTGKAREAHREVARRAIELTRSAKLVDALVVASASWPGLAATALARTVRSPTQAARMLRAIVAATPPGESSRVRSPARALDALLDGPRRRALVTHLRKTARGADPEPALVALSIVSNDRAGNVRFALAGAASARRCNRALGFLSVVEAKPAARVQGRVLTALFAKLFQPAVCVRARLRAANLLASIAREPGSPRELVDLGRRVARDDPNADVRQALSGF